MSTKYPGGFITKSPVAPSLAAASGIWSLDQAEQNIKANTWPLAATTLTRSLRFRSSATAYLNRTPASATNRKTWTWSGWVKRGTIGSGLQSLFVAIDASATNYLQISFNNDTLNFFANPLVSGGSVLITTAVYRDPAAWYHIVATLDTTDATAADRAKLYVNGSRVTAFTTNTASSITLNSDGYVNSAVQHNISNRQPFGNALFDGYMAEVNFVDGQALTPSSFGAYDGTTGVWQPAHYNGTYGTNGFYLPFTDNSALTTASNAGLGKDFSGNANYWVTNNISITAGTTYDSMTDVPTLTSATAANFAVLNPLSYRNTLSNTPPTNGNLTCTSDTNSRFFTSTLASSGSYYFEVTATTVAGGGVSARLWGSGDPQGVSSSDFAASYLSSTGEVYAGATLFATVATYTSGDIVAFAHNTAAGTIGVYKNNVLQTTVTGITTSSPVWPGCTVGASSVANINFGQRPFSYTPPSGFVALNTYNLPASTIQNGAAYMAATTYTGDGTANRVISGLSLTPDFIWIKNRNSTWDNILGNYVATAVSGAPITLVSNSTAAEVDGGYIGTQTTNSLRFSLNAGENRTNGSGLTYVAWLWKAGGTAVSNTNGTITSSVSANTTSGFSVVTYTGNGSSSATVGHGLGVTPSMIIHSARSTTTSWFTNHVGIPNSWIQLYTTGAAATSGGANGAIGYQSTNTSTTFTFTAGSSGVNNVNQSAATYVAYCFAAIKGFSAFGSYTANGSADGPFVYTGFRPRFVMLKDITTSGNGAWVMFDTTRNPSNVQGLQWLFADSSGAESTANSFGYFDILSNGFKCRGSGGNINYSGDSYIYAAFAESPFQNALAR